jgi:hypothetical protein
VAEPISKAAAKPAPAQARLILQDPLAFDQATQPALRSSLEMTAEPAVTMEREKARELWESLSLEPEVAQERQSERKRLLARADTLARETAAAKAQAIELQAQLAKARDERLNHPLVYAGAAGLLGLGALWFIERRKRVQLQERELEMLAQQSPSLMQEEAPSYLHEPNARFSLEDSPDLATDFATDLSGLPGTPSYAEKVPEAAQLGKAAVTSPAPSPAPSPTPRLESATTSVAAPQSSQPVSAPAPLVKKARDIVPEWAQPKSEPSTVDLPKEEIFVDMNRKDESGSLLSLSKRVLGNMLRRRSQRDAMGSMLPSTQSPSTVQHSMAEQSTMLHGDSEHDATQMMFDEEAQLAFEQELLEQQLQAGQAGSYDPDQANIDLLSQTRVVPQRGESAMEHLLELRTAVSGLCALGRPEGAAKLLAEHVAADPGTCAWAYLEYMHLCESIDQREDFESMRKQYRQQFNRMAPYWHEPNANVLGLDGYARAANELCAVWAQGREPARNALAAWLAGPLLGRKLVQLPAYHDLFDLYELLEFVQDDSPSAAGAVATQGNAAQPPLPWISQAVGTEIFGSTTSPEQEFVPTVSLLDLDYEFSSDVTLEEREVAQSETAVTVVKTGNFSVDFNVAGTQLGSLPSMPAELGKK